MASYDSDAEPFSLEGVRTKAKVVKVYDGDTFKCVFGLPELFGGRQYLWTCRVAGIDTPELRRAGPQEKAWGIAARNRMRELIMDKEIMVQVEGYDKYGRLLAVPFIIGGDGDDSVVRGSADATAQDSSAVGEASDSYAVVTEVDAGQKLIQEGLATAYMGYGKKTQWETIEPPAHVKIQG